MDTFIYLTYAPDRDKLWQSLRATRRLYPKERVVILMEGGKEFDKGFQTDLKAEYGVEIETTWFDRKRNLNGSSCIHGMWRYFSRFALESDRIFKIDCDVLMLRKPPEGSFISAWDNRPAGRIIFGMLYGIESPVVAEIWERWGEFMAKFHRMPRRRMAEDLWMRFALESTTQPHSKLLYESGDINVWKYKKDLEMRDLDKFTLFNAGFYRHQPDRDAQCETMKRANELIGAQ
jgi:hypothetical protein